MKREPNPRRHWLVEGRDGAAHVFFRQAYPLHLYSERQIGALLQALASKSSLTYDEIAGSLCRRNAATVFLKIRVLGPRYLLACGPRLEWTAHIIEAGDAIPSPVREWVEDQSAFPESAAAPIG